MQDKTEWQDLANIPGGEGRWDCQKGWQFFTGGLFNQQIILDVGSGLCLAKPRLENHGRNRVWTQDVGPGLPVDITVPVEKIRDKSYDVVTCFDVIEHIADDRAFLGHLQRIARRAVVLTTPNWDIYKAQNPYHIREYTEVEWLTFLQEFAWTSRWMLLGDSYGEKIRIACTDEEFLRNAERQWHFCSILYV